MLTNVKTSGPATVIKWTEEEWSKIALWLVQRKGAGLLTSGRLEDIKARDVFEAQEVLPEERHRKQISIAQGFQGIRVRLGELFDKIRQQDDLFAGQPDEAYSPEAVQLGTPPQTPIPLQVNPEGASHPEPDVDPHPRSVRPEPVPAATTRESEDRLEAAPSREGDQEPRPRDNVEASNSEATSDTAVEKGTRPLPSFTGSAGAKPAPAVDKPVATPAAARPDRKHAGQAEKAASGFIELARPFVAMACEELAQALIRALSEQLSSSFSTTAQSSSASSSSSRALAPRSGRVQTSILEGTKEPARANLPAEAYPAHSQEALDEEGSHPLEVQPLFDPKLPPSANSDFKPVIGLVATHVHEYEDLQLLYPQLKLVIVQADTIRGPEVFRDCQRVIGLRDEVPAPVDEVLKRTLRYRYLRLHGGALGVREQLNVWLSNPASINTAPRPQGPRNDKQPGNQHVKKRTKWPPRIER
jgi:hypothetical protein